MLKDKNILLIISGGIAAYKALELIRLLKKSGAGVRCILTKGGTQFITPLSVSALSEEPCYTDLFSLKDESEMGHIRLTREADLIIIAPATANIIAKMAQGLADDLASTTLLATDQNTPVLIAPAMNPEMWAHPATQCNVKTLTQRGVTLIGPCTGDTACGETGPGRMTEAVEIFDIIQKMNETKEEKPLSGKTALVTAGPTYEPLDPVRFIGNRSSGKQGYAIAAALAEAGAAVTLVSGPVSEDIKKTFLTPYLCCHPREGGGPKASETPSMDSHLRGNDNIKIIQIETAAEMLETCQKALKTMVTDIAICTAAVADYAPIRIETQKIKKSVNKTPQPLELKENPDILQAISQTGANRPALVIGFAAETENLLKNAREKRLKKGCDWILANDVAAENIFGADENHVTLITDSQTEEWPKSPKEDIAKKLVDRIVETIKERQNDRPNRNRTHAA